MKSARLTKAFVVGLLALLVSALLCELVTPPTAGHRIDVRSLPPAARAILAERPGAPVSPEQWKRLDKVMAQQGGWPNGRGVFLASVRASWYWFLLLPACGIAVLFIRWRAIAWPEMAAVAMPCLWLLLFSLSARPPMGSV